MKSQSYLWKVEYAYRKGVFSGWETRSKVFENKMDAMKLVNQLENSKKNHRSVRLIKWFGTAR